MLAYTRCEISRTLRNVRFLVFTIAMPATLYLLLNQIVITQIAKQGAVGGTGYASYLLVSMAGFGMINAAVTANLSSLPAERASGWLRQLRITPLPAPAWLAAKLAQATAVVVPGLAVLSLCGVLAGHVRLDAVQWVGFGALMVLGSFPFSVLGLLLGQLVDVQGAQAIVPLVTLGLGLGGGLFFPTSTFPAALQTVSAALPSHQLVALGQDLVAHHAPALGDLAGLAAWAAALAALTLATWRSQGLRHLAWT